MNKIQRSEVLIFQSEIVALATQIRVQSKIPRASMQRYKIQLIPINFTL